MDLQTRIVRVITSRWAFVVYSTVILLTGVSVFLSELGRFESFFNEETALEDLATGFGTILIGYGVLAEERETLMKVFRLYPRFETPAEVQIDHVCHVSGLGLLLLGLAAEIPVQLVKIPNDTVNTEGLEPFLFALSVLFNALALIFLVRFIVSLVRLRPHPADEPAH